MPQLGCTVLPYDGEHGQGTAWWHGPDLVHLVRPDGTHLERRLTLGYSPPFLELVPCPYCEAEDGRHDVLRHVDTHLRTTLDAP